MTSVVTSLSLFSKMMKPVSCNPDSASDRSMFCNLFQLSFEKVFRSTSNDTEAAVSIVVE